MGQRVQHCAHETSATRTAVPVMTRLQLVAHQLNDVVRHHLKPRQAFNILTFSNHVKAWAGGELRQVTAESIDEAVDFIRTLQPSGGTNLTDALASAFAQPGVGAVYLLSDGEPNMNFYGGAERLLAQVRSWSQRQEPDSYGAPPIRIPCHATSLLGGRSCQQLLERIAAETGGKVLSIESLSDMGFLFRGGGLGGGRG